MELQVAENGPEDVAVEGACALRMHPAGHDGDHVARPVTASALPTVNTAEAGELRVDEAEAQAPKDQEMSVVDMLQDKLKLTSGGGDGSSDSSASGWVDV